MLRKLLIGLGTLSLLAVAVSGCSSHDPEPKLVVVREPMGALDEEPVPGTVRDHWVEPVYDQIRVPGQIDRSGNYYRKEHTAIHEVRPGRYQILEHPDDYNSQFDLR